MSFNKRALISVYDKSGLDTLAGFLLQRGFQIISTGGTLNYLRELEIPVLDVSEVTHFPEILDGRVKTLHPNIHGGILANLSISSHVEAIEQLKIAPIDMVVVNLYPFFDKLKENLTEPQMIEFIDVGGPTMLRAAAKNFHRVTVVSSPSDYEMVMQEWKEDGLPLNIRKKLAAKVFTLTSAYDAAIAKYLLDEELPVFYPSSYQLKQHLRYGENPHQRAAFYEDLCDAGALSSFEQLSGKELSFNNIRDIDSAWKAVSDFSENVSCVAVKHSTPCGFAIGDNTLQAFELCKACDPVSIFGGVVAFNRMVDEPTALAMSEFFLEIIIAPDFETTALDILKKKKNLRLIKMHQAPKDKWTSIKVDGGLLVQETDSHFSDNLKVVTNRKPTDDLLKQMLFAQRVVKFVKSNAVVVCNDKQALGIGGGQVNRLWAAEHALKEATKKTSPEKLVLASDAFFPFSDIVELSYKYGVKNIIQPGGSIRDTEVIQKANELDMVMVFTGMRHFLH